MYITRKADYAIRCVLFLSREAGRIISANEISQSAFVPKSFLAKILQRLSKTGIVRSTQGIAGGFQLARPPDEVNLFEVIEAVQDPSALNICAINRHKCNLSSACAVHPIWVQIMEELEERLRNETFAKLIGKG
jgi:Rrf2 family protein